MNTPLGASPSLRRPNSSRAGRRGTFLGAAATAIETKKAARHRPPAAVSAAVA